MTPPYDGYWCEVLAHSPDTGEGWMLGGHQARTPRLALRWLRGRACRLADVLDPMREYGPPVPGSPHPAEPHGSDPSRVLRQWADDHHAHEAQLAALAAGEHISVNAQGPDRVYGWREVHVHYTLSCRPLWSTSPTTPAPTAPQYAPMS
ncbi:hypothetical protein V1J52_16070 [Streptomyces sp. TRM 70351]|uniref:hypothetical protein n=1 Tax=Streptomyces sp. TRM 70351 TaxID=3116552 RepID=UPI002E7AD875|nr:hypothetical protein [Streptomyces sp. TRM 70351]MEE1929684.1 hypothetical protein [Streptomyces sp. TRM 70351]